MTKGRVEAILYRATPRFASFIPCPFCPPPLINMPPRKRTATSKAVASYDTIEVDTQPLTRFLELSPDLFLNQLDSQAQAHAQTLEGSADLVPENEESAKLSWSYRIEEVLFEALLEQDRLGKRADAGFKSKAWVAVLAAVQAKYNLGSSKKKLTVAQLKNKESNYRGLFKDWVYLMDQSGFGKHLETRCVTATKEA
jgi:hypothetical protein